MKIFRYLDLLKKYEILKIKYSNLIKIVDLDFWEESDLN